MFYFITRRFDYIISHNQENENENMITDDKKRNWNFLT